MRQVLLQIFFLIIVLGHIKAQDSVFTLTGNVRDCQTNKSIKGVKLELFCSDGRFFETFSDTSGSYSFDSSVIKKNLEYFVKTQTSMNLGYLNTSDKYNFRTFDTLFTKNIKKDFCLSKNEGCGLRLPLLHYVKNSKTDYTFDQDVFDLVFLKELMEDNPTFVIEIGAHNSIDEKDALKLSENRLQYLFDVLIQSGVSKERLVLKNYGNEKPIVTAEEIKAMKTSLSKEDAYKKNRRVVFTIARRDYIKKN